MALIISSRTSAFIREFTGPSRRNYEVKWHCDFICICAGGSIGNSSYGENYWATWNNTVRNVKLRNVEIANVWKNDSPDIQFYSWGNLGDRNVLQILKKIIFFLKNFWLQYASALLWHVGFYLVVVWGSVVGAWGLSCPMARGILVPLPQISNPCLLHWKVDS